MGLPVPTQPRELSQQGDNKLIPFLGNVEGGRQAKKTDSELLERLSGNTPTESLRAISSEGSKFSPEQLQMPNEPEGREDELGRKVISFEEFNKFQRVNADKPDILDTAVNPQPLDLTFGDALTPRKVDPELEREVERARKSGVVPKSLERDLRKYLKQNGMWVTSKTSVPALFEKYAQQEIFNHNLKELDKMAASPQDDMPSYEDVSSEPSQEQMQQLAEMMQSQSQEDGAGESSMNKVKQLYSQIKDGAASINDFRQAFKPKNIVNMMAGAFAKSNSQPRAA